MDEQVRTQLASTGVLRVGVNLSNPLLVVGTDAAGDPVGVSPDMGREVASRLGVGVQFVPFASPGEVADAVAHDAWDIGNIGAEPQRAEAILFTPAYAEIEATYLVPAGSNLRNPAAVDAPGVRIAVKDRSAYGLWLERNLRHAELIRVPPKEDAFEVFASQGLEAFAGLRPGLMKTAERLAGARILHGNFTTVQQAIGTHKQNAAAAAWLNAFVQEAKASGLVARLIAKHGVSGLSVAGD